jgi:hypothetical protein
MLTARSYGAGPRPACEPAVPRWVGPQGRTPGACAAGAAARSAVALIIEGLIRQQVSLNSRCLTGLFHWKEPVAP